MEDTEIPVTEINRLVENTKDITKLHLYVKHLQLKRWGLCYKVELSRKAHLDYGIDYKTAANAIAAYIDYLESELDKK